MYANKYYEKLTGGDATLYYYHGDKMVAMKKGTTLSYVHQEHLTSTSVMSDAAGASLGSMRYLPFGAARTGTVPTEKKYTGQRLDSTGLYYCGARYYDADIGRFISADSIVPGMANPQALNRYSYVINNPLKYADPSGHGPETGFTEEAGGTVWGGGGSVPPPSAPVVTPTPPPAATSPATPVAGSGEGETGGGGGGSSASTGSSGPSTGAPQASLPQSVTPGVNAGAGVGESRADPAALALETMDTFAHQGYALVMSALVVAVGVALIVGGVASTPEGIGVAGIIGGVELVLAGSLGVWATWTAMRETWNREYGPRWQGQKR